MKIIMLAAIEAKCFNVNMIKQGLVSKRRVKPKKERFASDKNVCSIHLSDKGTP